jgi:hypothetical protein
LLSPSKRGDDNIAFFFRYLGNRSLVRSSEYDPMFARSKWNLLVVNRQDVIVKIRSHSFHYKKSVIVFVRVAVTLLCAVFFLQI